LLIAEQRQPAAGGKRQADKHYCVEPEDCARHAA
jgi:hypothetical protein